MQREHRLPRYTHLLIKGYGFHKRQDRTRAGRYPHSGETIDSVGLNGTGPAT